MDFEPKIARIHRKCRKMNAFESIARPGSVQNDVQKLLKNAKSAKIRENPRSVPFENARKFAFWPRPGNTLQKNMIFMIRSASGHVKVTLWKKRLIYVHFESKIVRIHAKSEKMSVSESKLLPWSVQNDVEKWSKIVKSTKITENPRWGPFKSAWEIMFWARPGNTLQNSVIFMSGALLATFR